MVYLPLTLKPTLSYCSIPFLLRVLYSHHSYSRACYYMLCFYYYMYYMDYCLIECIKGLCIGVV